MSWLLSTYRRDTNTCIIQDFYESKSFVFKQCTESGLLQTQHWHAIYWTIIKLINLGYCFLNAHGTFLKHILYRERNKWRCSCYEQHNFTTELSYYTANWIWKLRSSSKRDSSATLSYKGGTVTQLKRQSPENRRDVRSWHMNSFKPSVPWHTAVPGVVLPHTRLHSPH